MGRNRITSVFLSAALLASVALPSLHALTIDSGKESAREILCGGHSVQIPARILKGTTETFARPGHLIFATPSPTLTGHNLVSYTVPGSAILLKALAHAYHFARGPPV